MISLPAHSYSFHLIKLLFVGQREEDREDGANHPQITVHQIFLHFQGYSLQHFYFGKCTFPLHKIVYPSVVMKRFWLQVLMVVYNLLSTTSTQPNFSTCFVAFQWRGIMPCLRCFYCRITIIAGSNTIQSSPNVELGKLHELNLTCGRPRVSENVISINVTFTNATSVCREHSNATGMVATTRVSTITDTDVLSTSPTQFCREEEQDAIDRQTFIATATTVSGASAVGFGGVALYAVKRGRCQKKPNDERY